MVISKDVYPRGTVHELITMIPYLLTGPSHAEILLI